MRPRFAAGRAGFAAEARGVGRVFEGQLFHREDFLAVEIRHWDFGCGNEEEVASGHPEEIGLEFGQLSRAGHGRTIDQKWRAHFGVAVVARVQVEQERNERPFEPCALPGVANEPTPADFRRALGIE
jgi:hypothetical protein